MSRSIGSAIRDARRAAGWTQAELAMTAGVSQSHVSMIERGAVTHRVTTRRICELLGIDSDLDALTYGRIFGDTTEVTEEIQNDWRLEPFDKALLVMIYKELCQRSTAALASST
jgi:transcriptional regulator with XRE-family HTH domain